MMTARLLYLTAREIVAYDCGGAQCTEEGSFDSEAPGEEFLAYLHANRSSLFSLVVNVAEEGFQTDTIPFLQSGDRSTVIKRRLNQLFQGTPLALDISLGYEKSRRKDEKLLMLGLTNAEMFEPLFNALQLAETRVVGVYSLPLLSRTLLTRMKVPAQRVLLVTLQDHSIRQSFFDNDTLVFSRFSQLANSSVSGVSQAIRSEVARFQQYLLSQRLISRNDTLNVFIPLHADIKTAVETSLVEQTNLRFNVIDIQSLAKSAGLKGTLTDSSSQKIFAHLAIESPTKQQFAPPPLRKQYQLWQMGRALRAVGVVAFAGCVLFAVKTWFESHELRDTAAIKTAEASAIDARYQNIVKTFPPVPVAKDVLRQVVGQYDALAKQAVLPHDALRILGAALDASPEVEIQKLEWAVGGDADLAKNLPPSQSGEAEREILLIQGTIAATRRTSPEEDPKTAVEGNARQLLANFDAFTRRVLGPAELGQEIYVLQQPFDVTSGTALRSGTSALSTSEPRRFSLALIRRLGA